MAGAISHGPGARHGIQGGRRLRIHRQGPHGSVSCRPMLSFVVPAYNEEKYLGPTLASIHEAARAVGESYEIIVANDNSSDATAQLAEAGGARVINVHKRQIAGTRNAGARAASGEWLVVVGARTRGKEGGRPGGGPAPAAGAGRRRAGARF